jgi:hypothetical protein
MKPEEGLGNPLKNKDSTIALMTVIAYICQVKILAHINLPLLTTSITDFTPLGL